MHKHLGELVSLVVAVLDCSRRLHLEHHCKLALSTLLFRRLRAEMVALLMVAPDGDGHGDGREDSKYDRSGDEDDVGDAR